MESEGSKEEPERMETAEDQSESDESSDEDDELQQQITELRSEVDKNPYYYDGHVKLIKVLKQCGELKQLREARKVMSELFPLTEEIWTDWLQDEIPLISCDEERVMVTKLFDKAVQDYLSIPLWLEYVQFSIGEMAKEGGIDHIRSTFERAITAGGLHMTKGASLWEAYREFENAILSGLQPSIGSIPSPEQQSQIEDQINRISTLFKRQLAVPLMDMEDTYEEYQQWVSDDIDVQTQKAYEKAVAKLKVLKPYEEALLAADIPRLAEYQSYIDFELTQSDPSRIQCLFERAIQENCLVPDLWVQYTKYLDMDLKIPSLALEVYERGVRNCPWCVELWTGYLRALERAERPQETIKECLNKALSMGFTQASDYLQLYTAYCDYLRRKIKWEEGNMQNVEEFRNECEKAIDYLYTAFGNDGDPLCTLQQYWARIEAKQCKNMAKARELWNQIMTAGFGNQAQMWMEYFNLERAHGDNKHCRKLLQQAVNSVNDWPETMCETYINFEREEGTLSQYDIAVTKCAAQLNRVKERRAKAAEKKAFEDTKKDRMEKKPGKRTEHKPQKPRGGQKQQEQQQSFQPIPTVLDKKDPKKPIGQKTTEKATPSLPSKEPTPNVFKTPPPPGYKPRQTDVEEPPSKRMKTSEKTESQICQDVTEHGANERTVFLSNLAYSVEEDKIKGIFSECGEIVDVRLIKNFKGLSKGYGYIEFTTTRSAENALKKDRLSVEGRPVFVSPCMDKDHKTKQFKFSSSMEKNKLFVKGLPFSVTEEALRTIFGQHGKLKEIRLVTYRSGAPKGLAYVEYENEADAGHAVLKTDGLQIEDHTISVAISNPPQRKVPVKERETSSFIASLGGGKKETTERGKARTQLSMVPRALQSRGAPSKPAAAGNKSDTSARAPSDNPSEQKLSNSDFRKMLLKN
ncbi:squamous cell carcinoma antigen recognized by T-cells 3 [Lingula anatina]|uniref:Squamous cell carcinoma antigen recognized by T-cells 3 n=1 Tax=Lingula anatina TaxID=7574 RepID=A0A1S3I9A3_LINAN|nr:squamous cell carcinoma antigen recognized by T-cells 3 [Lingula anatina]|eukprot:XP_013394832.1 squamous cell carcinoma antigen recognized by T-cells 3 [Lingula anatina]